MSVQIKIIKSNEALSRQYIYSTSQKTSKIKYSNVFKIDVKIENSNLLDGTWDYIRNFLYNHLHNDLSFKEEDIFFATSFENIIALEGFISRFSCYIGFKESSNAILFKLKYR